MFYGLDVHKQFIQVCEIDAKGAKRKDYRIGGSAEEIDRWAQGLGPRDQVVLETTFHRSLICTPEGDAFSARGRRWMRSRELPSAERFLVDNGLDLLEAIETRIDATDQQLLKTAAIEEQAHLLMTIPGVGVSVSSSPSRTEAAAPG